MKAWMMALIAGKSRLLKTAGPYTANAVWVAPVSTSRIETSSGKGAAGTPAYDDSVTKYYIYKYQYYIYVFPDNSTLQSSETYISRTLTTSGSPTPGGYCNDIEPYSGIGSEATGRYTCYRFEKKTVKTGGYHPATTGAATTAFGKNYPGGVGGPAPTTTHNDVVITPGASYPLTVPAGGSLTFTYYE